MSEAGALGRKEGKGAGCARSNFESCQYDSSTVSSSTIKGSSRGWMGGRDGREGREGREGRKEGTKESEEEEEEARRRDKRLQQLLSTSPTLPPQPFNFASTPGVIYISFSLSLSDSRSSPYCFSLPFFLPLSYPSPPLGLPCRDSCGFIARDKLTPSAVAT